MPTASRCSLDDFRRAAELWAALSRDPRTRLLLLDEIVGALPDAASRARVLGVLHALRRLGPVTDPRLGLRVVRTPLRSGAIDDDVDLLLAPSIFDPEEWSYTFLEGLLRRPLDAYAGKTLIELGTGSGWVSLALLRSTDLDRVIAYDLNPIAIRIARINAVLASFDETGQPLAKRGGKLLCERFEVAESDLLSTALAQQQTADLIVGCIPQVLAPNPDLDPSTALGELDAQRLYDLSNYFILQGVYEDQFGLGLVARAIEQAAHVLGPSGRLILNVAGRPGATVIDSMFARRGFQSQEIWSRRVQQAEDTDISVLATLEQRTGNPFEFFVGPHSRQPIGATTAHSLRQSQRPIFHDLRVLEAQLRFDRELRPFYGSMRELGYEGLLAQLDLSQIADEQVRSLRALADSFLAEKRAPYTHERGGLRLRQLVARYLRLYFDVSCQPDDVFIAPSRADLVRAILYSLTDTGDRVLFSQNVADTYRQSAEKADVGVILGNNDLSELATLAEALDPSLVVLSQSSDERRNHSALRRLLESARDKGQVVVIDGSDEFEITSKLHENALFTFVANEDFDNLIVVVGLTKNRVYPQLSPAFCINPGPGLSRALAAYAEASYSRVNTFTERYYQGLFDEILAFQLRRRTPTPPSLRPRTAPTPHALSSRIQRVLEWPIFEAPGQSVTSPQGDLIRLDRGENELPLPDRLTQGILLGFTELFPQPDDERLGAALAGYYESREGAAARGAQFALGAGVFPLLSDASWALRERLGRAPQIALPVGHYGSMPPLFTLAGCHVQSVPSDPSRGFLLTADALRQLPHPVDAVAIVSPNNPSGVYYDLETLQGLVDYAREHNAWIFSDEVFSDLDLSNDSTVPPRLTDCDGIAQILGRVLRFDGLSKSFAAGGLRFGWMRGHDMRFVARVRALRTGPVDRQARVGADVLFRGFLGEGDERQAAADSLRGYREHLSRTLRERRARLVSVLHRMGATLPGGRPGGLFVFPNVRAWHGRHVTTADGPTPLSERSVVPILHEQFGLRVNSGAWAGTAGHVRICFSLREADFTEALRRLQAFALALCR